MTEQVTNKQPAKASRVGKLPVALPKGVSVTVADRVVNVKGVKGTLTWELPGDTDVQVQDGRVVVSSSAVGRAGARLQGLTRALIANMVRGTSEGFTRTLELVGTGYRAEVKGQTLQMALGYSHPVLFPIPKGITIVVPPDSKGMQVVVSGADRGLVGQTAARIRDARPPEPYAGKGVRYRGERVREKAGKAGKGAKGGR
ncbi:MAG: 50S ribosomal protein L6 [Polyangiaceae bacterium]|jgi:large subunit ribosomal protein L6|nr:50S ribosomal protein L6 [Polyangiaceae bacterium]